MLFHLILHKLIFSRKTIYSLIRDINHQNDLCQFIKKITKQNAGHPFNPETNILYKLIRPEHVVLKIYNTLDQEIVTLADERKSTDHFSVRWDGKDRHGTKVPSSLYFLSHSSWKFR